VLYLLRLFKLESDAKDEMMHFLQSSSQDLFAVDVERRTDRAATKNRAAAEIGHRGQAVLLLGKKEDST